MNIFSGGSIRLGLALSSVLGLAAVAAPAADAPKDNVGFSSSQPTVVDLAPEFPATAGLALRQRVLTIKPGGHIGLHSHKDRPSVVYFVQGTDTVTRDDGTSHTFHPGDTTAETGATVHWHKNDGNDDVVLIATDVIRSETPK
jgi:quercetin dioxygenase-like cupin family protein